MALLETTIAQASLSSPPAEAVEIRILEMEINNVKLLTMEIKVTVRVFYSATVSCVIIIDFKYFMKHLFMFNLKICIFRKT